MTDTTSIMDLPTDPAGGGNMNQPVTLTATEKNKMDFSSGPESSGIPSLSLDQTTINQIVSGLQHASVTGATQLPSRNIPQMTHNITQDAQVHPNYVPSQPANQPDYIREEENEDHDDILRKYNKNKSQSNSLDEMYDEIQRPLLLIILFFLFQLPFFKKNLFHYFPALFNKDGNYNISGFGFTSILFGLLFYFLDKIMFYFGKF